MAGATTVHHDKSPVEALWEFTLNDTAEYSFDMLDETGAVIADPVGSGWAFYGQLRDARGGAVLGQVVFALDGPLVSYTWPVPGSGSFYGQIQVTSPDGEIVTTESGEVRALPDSAEEV